MALAANVSASFWANIQLGPPPCSGRRCGGNRPACCDETTCYNGRCLPDVAVEHLTSRPDCSTDVCASQSDCCSGTVCYTFPRGPLAGKKECIAENEVRGTGK